MIFSHFRTGPKLTARAGLVGRTWSASVLFWTIFYRSLVRLRPWSGRIWRKTSVPRPSPSGVRVRLRLWPTEPENRKSHIDLKMKLFFILKSLSEWFFENFRFSDFLGIKSEINQSGSLQNDKWFVPILLTRHLG